MRFRHVAAAACFHGKRAVLPIGQEFDKSVPLFAGDFPVPVGVHGVEHVLHERLLCLLARQESVAFGPGLLEHFIEARQLKRLVVGAAGRPTGEKEYAVRHGGRSARARRHARKPPFLGTSLQIVADNPPVARRYHLLAVRRRPHDRRAVGNVRLSLGLPAELSRFGIDGNTPWFFHFIAHEDDQSVHQDGRDAAAEMTRNVRRRQLVLPKLFARQVITEEPAGAEVRHDALAVGGRCGGGRRPFRLVERLHLLGGRYTPPLFRTVGATIGDRVELAAIAIGTATFQSTFFSGPNDTGGLAPSATPEPFGPRNCGQARGLSSPRPTDATSKTVKSAVSRFISSLLEITRLVDAASDVKAPQPVIYFHGWCLTRGEANCGFIRC